MTDFATISDQPIRETVIDPPYAVANVRMGSMNLTVLRLQHPRFGLLDFILAPQSIQHLGSLLCKIADDGEPRSTKS